MQTDKNVTYSPGNLLRSLKDRQPVFIKVEGAFQMCHLELTCSSNYIILNGKAHYFKHTETNTYMVEYMGKWVPLYAANKEPYYA